MEPPSSHSVIILNEFSRRAPRALITRAASATLDLHRRAGETVNILLTTSEHVRGLNAQFRGVDEDTDVLTFASDDVEGAGLGDIAISVPYAIQQAGKRGVPTDQEIAYLAIHGCLHLLGLDDENDRDRAEMMVEMNRAAAAAGLPTDAEWSSILHAEAS